VSKDEIEFDLSKISLSKDSVKSFFKKYGVILLILIPIVFSSYLRLIPEDIPLTDNWAKSTVDAYYKNNIRTQIKQQYPNLPDENINNLINQQYAEFYQQNEALITQQIKETSQEFKSQFKDENGYTYMPDIDPYSWLRYARNYLDHGYMGDEIRNGVQWDNHMIAPKGKPAPTTPHPIVLAYLHKIFSTFNAKITVMQSATYAPVIFAALSIIPIFFIGKMVAGSIGGFFAALMLAVNGAFLGRTTWGHADTDSYAILFALYFLWFFFLTLQAQTTKKQAIYGAAGGLTLGLFSVFWTGWWYVFDFALATAGTYLLYLLLFETKEYSINKLKENKTVKNLVIASFIIIISSAVFVSLFTNTLNFTQSIVQPIAFSKIKVASQASLWPNVYTTVAELNTASFNTIIDSIGGGLFFYTSLIGILLLLLTKTEGRRTYIPYALFAIFWYIGIYYASTKGIRFTMMLVPPLAIGIGAAIGILYKKITAAMEKMDVSRKVTGTILILLVLLTFLPYVRGAAQAVKNDIPIVNDAWYNSLNKIRLESQPNAIINSWWDFGHHFKYLADRAVTFDGASQSTPMAHWIGRVLLTDNEREATGILRMLDCGSNDAFEELNKVVNDTPMAVNLLYSIIVLDRSQAESYLAKNNINKETTQKVLALTHCIPPEDYFITSEDMVGKAAVWAHFGSWNFDKADIWLNTKSMQRDEAQQYIQKRLNVNEEEAKKVYFQLQSIASEGDANAWIAPWPGYGGEQGCAKQDNKLVCGGVVIDLATKDVEVHTDKGIQKPSSLIYVENNQFIEKKFENSIPQSILLIQEGSSYRIVLASQEVAGSMFTRLFYYNGIGTQHFTKFTQETQITGEKIIVWKVQW
jgi:asparagine N-glycosylation enzyme membrane subunit Stt3